MKNIKILLLTIGIVKLFFQTKSSDLNSTELPFLLMKLAENMYAQWLPLLHDPLHQSTTISIRTENIATVTPMLNENSHVVRGRGRERRRRRWRVRETRGLYKTFGGLFANIRIAISNHV
jgi:hypothetical protein